MRVRLQVYINVGVVHQPGELTASAASNAGLQVAGYQPLASR